MVLRSEQLQLTFQEEDLVGRISGKSEEKFMVDWMPEETEEELVSVLSELLLEALNLNQDISDNKYEEVF
jgi:hypothetical protein